MWRLSIIPVILFMSFIEILPAQDNYEFGPSIRVNDDPAGTHGHNTTQRSVACRGDTAYAVWRDDRYGNSIWWNSRVFFSKSTDAGNTWSPNLMISQDLDTLWAFQPHLALDASGDIYAAYSTVSNNDNDRDIYFTKSTSGGTSFTPPIMVNDSAVVKPQTNCACAVDSSGSYVYVVWQDLRNPQYDEDIYLARSTDGGASFLPAVRVNDDFDTTRQWFPVIACNNSGQYVYVAWQDFRDIGYGANVYFTRSTDYGQTFAVNYCVNDTTTTGVSKQGNPSIYYKNDIIYLAWRDERDGYCIYFNKSTNGGVSFSEDVRVPDDSNAYGQDPSITADDSGNVCIAWYDFRNFTSTGYDIYFSYSNDGGVTFKADVLVNDSVGIISAWDMRPAVAVNQDGAVFVIWDSDRNDAGGQNNDIYFAKGTVSGIEEKKWLAVNNNSVNVYPNPFSMQTVIRLQMTNGRSQIKIYDVSGCLVRILSINQSNNQIRWDGRNDYGMVVPDGIYFCTVNFPGKRVTKKIVKIK